MDVVVNHLDRDGNVKSTFTKPCDSFNYNFMRFLCNSIGASALYNFVDTGNVSRSISPGGIMQVINTSPGNTTYGIRVGTDGTASAPTDYNLLAMVPQGMGDNQLICGGMPLPTVDILVNTIKLHIRRTFINAGTVSITMRELDLVATPGGYAIEILRDAISDQVIPSLDGVAIEIVIQVTV